VTALNFKPTFAPYITARTKPHTIRAPRKTPIHHGQALQLYTGMRTKACRKIGDAVCQSTAEITIDPERRTIHLDVIRSRTDLQTLPYKVGTQCAQATADLIRADGFEDESAFWAFFTHPDGQAFTGHRPPPAESADDYGSVRERLHGPADVKGRSTPAQTGTGFDLDDEIPF
jgi:hypothetical protein